MQYKITKVFKKTGTSEKTGEAWNKVLIQTETTGTDWLSGWANELNADWKVGSEVKLKLTEREYNGKKYFDYDIIMPEVPKEKVKANGEAPKTTAEMSMRLLLLEAQMKVVAEKLGLATEAEDDEIEKLRKETGEINPDDIPF